MSSGLGQAGSGAPAARGRDAPLPDDLSAGHQGLMICPLSCVRKLPKVGILCIRAGRDFDISHHAGFIAKFIHGDLRDLAIGSLLPLNCGHFENRSYLLQTTV